MKHYVCFRPLFTWTMSRTHSLFRLTYITSWNCISVAVFCHLNIWLLFSSLGSRHYHFSMLVKCLPIFVKARELLGTVGINSRAVDGTSCLLCPWQRQKYTLLYMSKLGWNHNQGKTSDAYCKSNIWIFWGVGSFDQLHFASWIWKPSLWYTLTFVSLEQVEDLPCSTL